MELVETAKVDTRARKQRESGARRRMHKGHRSAWKDSEVGTPFLAEGTDKTVQALGLSFLQITSETYGYQQRKNVLRKFVKAVWDGKFHDELQAETLRAAKIDAQNVVKEATQHPRGLNDNAMDGMRRAEGAEPGATTVVPSSSSVSRARDIINKGAIRE